MAAVDDKTAKALREEAADVRMAVARKRNEISNLKTGYIRAVEGTGAIPAEPLRRNLVAARAELTELESRLEALHAQLGEPERPDRVH